MGTEARFHLYEMPGILGLTDNEHHRGTQPEVAGTQLLNGYRVWERPLSSGDCCAAPPKTQSCASHASDGHSGNIYTTCVFQERLLNPDHIHSCPFPVLTAKRPQERYPQPVGASIQHHDAACDLFHFPCMSRYMFSPLSFYGHEADTPERCVPSVKHTFRPTHCLCPLWRQFLNRDQSCTHIFHP